MSVLERLDTVARSTISRLAADWQCEPAAILAVIEVESGGRIFATVHGRAEPLIRFEGHYFHRRLDGVARARAHVAGLAHPSAGRIRNPRSQAGRWAMLKRAKAIHAAAALESCSWGLGQVMGAHWRALGYVSVDALVTEARSGAAGQIELMARFIENADLEPTLAARDWHRFARAYNGPAYRRRGYHTKLARAYAQAATRDWKVETSPPPLAASTTGLSFGVRGASVKRLQAALTQAGHVLIVDGVFGLRTRAALEAWQRERGVASTGVVGLAAAWALLGPSAWWRLVRDGFTATIRGLLSKQAPSA